MGMGIVVSEMRQWGWVVSKKLTCTSKTSFVQSTLMFSLSHWEQVVWVGRWGGWLLRYWYPLGNIVLELPESRYSTGLTCSSVSGSAASHKLVLRLPLLGTIWRHLNSGGTWGTQSE